MLLEIFLLIAGLFLLVKGADWLVRGAVSLARILNMSERAIGLTVVSLGTTIPELFVSMIATYEGNGNLVMGNAIGSTTTNTLLILGIAASVRPLAVQRSTVLKEIPFSFLATLVLFFVSNDILLDGFLTSVITRSDGGILLSFLLIFLYYALSMESDEQEADKEPIPTYPLRAGIGLVACGAATLGIGARITVTYASIVARDLGISDALIGLTIIAIGTSLPELFTAITATRKGKVDIALGNIIGSNIFTIFCTLGLSSFIRPISFDPLLNTDIVFAIMALLILFFFVHTGKFHHRILFWRQTDGHRVERWEGLTMLSFYAAYLCFIVLRG